MFLGFVKKRPIAGEPGSAPRFPPGTDFLLLADSRAMGYGLYRYNLPASFERWSPDYPIDSFLLEILDSAVRYPPAMALMREQIAHSYGEHEPSATEFAEAIERALRRHLQRRSEADYMEVCCRNEEFGYLSPSVRYWVLGLSDLRQDAVRWVSDDFHVYVNPIEDFEFTESQLIRLRERK